MTAPIDAPTTAMVLAAGLGTRLRPITDGMPKPLVRIRGRALLDHAIDRLADAKVETVVVNTYYRAEQIVAHLATRTSPRIVISAESDLLETGGGVAKALPLLDEQFYVVNADVFWLDGKVQALERLHLAVEPEYIGVDDVELFVEQRQGLGNAAAGLEQIALRRNDDARRGAGGEMGDDLLGSIIGVDDDRLDLGVGEPVYRMIEQGAAADANERLGHAVGDRPQPRAE